MLHKSFFFLKGPSDGQQLNSLIEKENQQVVKKSGKSRPLPKLNEATITGPKGIQALRESFKNYKPDPLKDPVCCFTKVAGRHVCCLLK
ncbi:hypothetical protein ANCDUO_23541 [Ancylostoma duodenale]|uniref:Uncharacterized protein n=1 Tax=Ancylostoma duodenale TaxID=51022 RepID=A0A0C2BRI8_9BILA|nr:hypothetical protein ANCDUO_23541 [Ancylostoma duodenale]